MSTQNVVQIHCVQFMRFHRLSENSSLLVALDEKPPDQQIHQVSSSGDHECLSKVLSHSSHYRKMYFSQTKIVDRLTNRLTKTDIPTGRFDFNCLSENGQNVFSSFFFWLGTDNPPAVNHVISAKARGKSRACSISCRKTATTSDCWIKMHRGKASSSLSTLIHILKMTPLPWQEVIF